MIPVTARRRFARRYNIVAADVSGTKTYNTCQLTPASRQGASLTIEIKDNPTLHTTSHIDHRHPLTGTLNPAISGPNDGPAKGQNAYTYNINGNQSAVVISPIVPPAIHNAGAPKSPSRNRNTINPAALFASAVGIDNTKNRNCVTKYTQLRPIAGISDSGPKSRGPIP